MPRAGGLVLLAGFAAGVLPALAQAPLPHIVVQGAPVAVGTADDAQRAFDARDFPKARAIWQVLAQQGDDRAAILLAGLLDQGVDGMARDPVAALRWYGVAAERGAPAAEFDVGIMLDSGRGTGRDVAKAATWYARAAARGYRRAQYNLGQLYAAGEGVPLNPAASRAWYDLAARNGVTAAVAKLMPAVSLPSTGRPVPQLAPDPDLHQAVMQAPFSNQTVKSRSAGGVEFVWLAPAQSAPVIFFVEVAAVEGRSTRPAASRYVAETATVLDVGATPGDYIWRVYVVDQRRQRYVAAEWQRFSIAAPEARHD